MDDESSSPKLNFYLLFSADTDQQQAQRQLTCKENKVGVWLDVQPKHTVRRLEVKQARQIRARKQATLKNMGRQRRTNQALRNERKRWIVTLGGTKNRSLTKAASQADGANRLGGSDKDRGHQDRDRNVLIKRAKEGQGHAK